MRDDERETYRECTLFCYDELLKEFGRPPTIQELTELTGISIPITRAFLTIAGKPLTDRRWLRRKGHGT